jgi:hypothetical protein
MSNNALQDERWPGGMDRSGAPALNAANQAAVEARRLARKAAYKAKEAAKHGDAKAERRLRRANALDRHARMVYDTDRDIGGEFSAE